MSEQVKTNWERGKDALEIVMQHFTIEQIEALAVKLNEPSFKKSFKYKALKTAITNL